METTVQSSKFSTKAVTFHRHMSLRIFNGMKKDVKVTIGKTTFDCHKCVLTTWSGYFRASMSHAMKESLSGVVKIPESELVQADAFTTLHNYMYTESLGLTDDNFLPVLTTSHYLQMVEVLGLALDYLRREYNGMSPQVLIAITERLGNITDLAQFRQITLQHIAHTIGNYCIEANGAPENSSIEFSLQLMEDLLKEEYLNLTEPDIFKDVMVWLATRKGRMVHADRLLRFVRLGRVPYQLLATALTPDFVPHIPVHHPVILAIMEGQWDNEKAENVKKMLPIKFKKRKMPSDEIQNEPNHNGKKECIIL